MKLKYVVFTLVRATSACCAISINGFFTRVFDWNRLPIAELDRHDVQNGRDHANSELELIEMVHAIDYAYDMPYKVPCANSCASSNLIMLCH